MACGVELTELCESATLSLLDGTGLAGWEGWSRSQGKSSGAGSDAATAGVLLAVLRCLHYSLTIIITYAKPLQIMF